MLAAAGRSPPRFPANGASNVSPDTRLVLTFRTHAASGSAGRIRVFDADTGVVVDTIDLAAPEQRTSLVALRRVSGFCQSSSWHDGTIALHNKCLAYGRVRRPRRARRPNC
jgi:hypothetical protein